MAKQPPFTTSSGLRIGVYYQPQRPVHHDRDALRIQTALLSDRQPGAIEILAVRLFRRFWAWC